MTRRSALSLLLVGIALPAFTLAAGGWAITTVEDLPEYLVAGAPTEIAFTIRGHGVSPAAGLKPVVEARSGETVLRVDASPGKKPGQYAAQLVVPRPGDWTVTIYGMAPRAAGLWVDTPLVFGRSELLPIPAIPAGSRPPAPVPAYDRGAQLFVAKGCVGCHVQGMIDRQTVAAVGPALTGRTFPPDYLTKQLTDPVSVRGTQARMPNLGLRPAEIRALIAFINTGPIDP